ncbi:MAG: 5-formyltetrahydrofolate cyclo-ligase [Candidatus Arsenophonus melophagi]|nr:5-formyltetrahydrofolate cyclo-ligase [Candidatus Arsenophonus melophagi]
MCNNLRKQKTIIRTTIRQYRRKLTCAQQKSAADKITQRVLVHKLIQSAFHIGCFFSFDGEISTDLLIQNLLYQKKKIYLPTLDPLHHSQLLFTNYCHDTFLIRNRFNIFEPMLSDNNISSKNIITISQLDVLFVPLVAFDKHGQRLGMGGGFYDRLLLNWRKKNFFPIGLAHDCQLVDKIPSEKWDMPLPEIITPSKRWRNNLTAINTILLLLNNMVFN